MNKITFIFIQDFVDGGQIYTEFIDEYLKLPVVTTEFTDLVQKFDFTWMDKREIFSDLKIITFYHFFSITL